MLKGADKYGIKFLKAGEFKDFPAKRFSYQNLRCLVFYYRKKGANLFIKTMMEDKKKFFRVESK